MDTNVKDLLQHYLTQLDVIVSKIPSEMFPFALADDMFPLEVNAKIVADFALRGYCPLLDMDVVSFARDESGKDAVRSQISETVGYLEGLPNVEELGCPPRVVDQAGFSEVELPAREFIYQYIVPNILFHISMVYSIARANGVNLSKGDYDGFHSYLDDFSFV